MGSAASIGIHDNFKNDSIDVQHMFGVKFSYCLGFLNTIGGREAFEGKSTKQVYEEIIWPRCMGNEHYSFCEILKQSGSIEVTEAVAPANIYICHTWSAPFLSVTDVLSNYFSNHSSLEDPVIWMDIFSLDHQTICSRSSEMVCKIPQIIQQIGHIVLVLTSWKDPIPLKRCWCLWEIFSASFNEAYISKNIIHNFDLKIEQTEEYVECESDAVTSYSPSSHITFDIAMMATDEVQFMEDMLAGAVHHVDHLREIIDIRQSECSIHSDHNAILSVINKTNITNPIYHFNHKVFNCIRKWIFDKLEAALHIFSENANAIREPSMEGISCAEKENVDVTSTSIGGSLQAMTSTERYWTLKLVLGKLYISQDDWDAESNGAQNYLIDGFRYCQDRYGEDHPETLNIMYHLARCHDKQGQIVDALNLYEQALAKQRLVLGSDHRDTFRTLTHYGAMLYNQGYFDDALPLYEEGLEKRKELHMDLFGILWMHSLANLYYKQSAAALSGNLKSKSSKALLSLKTAQLIESAVTNSKSSPNLVRNIKPPSHSMDFNPKERQQQALKLYVECVDQLRYLLQSLTGRNYDLGSPESMHASVPSNKILDKEEEKELNDAEVLLMKALFNAAAIYSKQEDYDDALPLYQSCLALRRRCCGNDHPDTIKTILNTAVTHFKMNESKEAMSLYSEYYSIKLQQYGPRHPESLSALQNIAICHERLKEYDRAMSMYEECLTLRKEVLGMNHPETKSSEKAIEKLKKKIVRRRVVDTTTSKDEEYVESYSPPSSPDGKIVQSFRPGDSDIS